MPITMEYIASHCSQKYNTHVPEPVHLYQLLRITPALASPPQSPLPYAAIDYYHKHGGSQILTAALLHSPIGRRRRHCRAAIAHPISLGWPCRRRVTDGDADTEETRSANTNTNSAATNRGDSGTPEAASHQLGPSLRRNRRVAQRGFGATGGGGRGGGGATAIGFPDRRAHGAASVMSTPRSTTGRQLTRRRAPRRLFDCRRDVGGPRLVGRDSPASTRMLTEPAVLTVRRNNPPVTRQSRPQLGSQVSPLDKD